MPTQADRYLFHSLTGGFMSSAMTEHLRINAPRSMAECLDDLLPHPIHTIEIPDDYDLDDRYQRTLTHVGDSPHYYPATTPPTSFAINATTWRELAAATPFLVDIPGYFDIFPTDIYLEDGVALVCCDT